MTIWHRHLIVFAATTTFTLALFAHDVGDMASQWLNASTYGHCLFVPLIVAWLIWQRRGAVARVEPHVWTPGLFLVALAAFGWLVGEAAGLAIVRQAALVAMLQASALTILGLAVFRALLFPLFYVVFLIPFGDEFVPSLQLLTARMAIGLLHLAQVPAQLDGVFITTPNGWFEVAEACSGVKFLIAMITFGALVANVCFVRPTRRAAFMILCLVAPVIANGVRAFATIYAAQLTDAETATGIDHIVYGWFFFAFVLVLVMLIARPFFDQKSSEGASPQLPVVAGRGKPPFAAAFALAAIVALPPVWMASRSGAGPDDLPYLVSLPNVAGWTRVSTPVGYPWVPRFDGADHRLYGRYRSVRGQSVDVAVGLYASQGRGREIVGYGQGAIDPDSKWAWTEDVPAPNGAKAERMTGPGGRAREAATFYVLGGRATGDVMSVKLKTLKGRLWGGDQRAAVFIVSAEVRPAIDDFLDALGPVEKRVTHLFAVASGQ